MNWKLIDQLVGLALAEDIGPGDITTEATIPPELEGRGTLISKSSGILAGLPVAEKVLAFVNENLQLRTLKQDGDTLEVGTVIGRIVGPMGPMLTAERTLLNFLQRLSGVATGAARYVQEIEGTKARIVDTRKTTPGWRVLEKYAVNVGGGHNHRIGLYDAVLIKDNHIAAAGGVLPAVEAARAQLPDPMMKIEVEVENETQLQEALVAKADIIMLDNMSPAAMQDAVRIIAGRATVEASGGINLETVAEVAATGVDLISIGALTHSALPLDISLEIDAG